MALYKYIAAIPGESAREMIIEADTEKEALGKLRSRGAVPIRFLGDASQEGRGSGFSLRKSRINTYEFTRQLAPLLDSAIPLERALAIIAEGAQEQDQKNHAVIGKSPVSNQNTKPTGKKTGDRPDRLFEEQRHACSTGRGGKEDRQPEQQQHQRHTDKQNALQHGRCGFRVLSAFGELIFPDHICTAAHFFTPVPFF